VRKKKRFFVSSVEVPESDSDLGILREREEKRRETEVNLKNKRRRDESERKQLCFVSFAFFPSLSRLSSCLCVRVSLVRE
jgi:hypothetical protein